MTSKQKSRSSTPETLHLHDPQLTNKAYYAPDAEFEEVNTIEIKKTLKPSYIDLGERAFGRPYHQTYQAICGTHCKWCRSRAYEHHMHYLQDINQLIEPISFPSKQELVKDPWPEPEGWPAPYEDAKWDDAQEKYEERINQTNVCDYPEDIKWLEEEEPDWPEDRRWDTAERPKTYPG